ncbi:unnamed protein product [Cylindrotheca closterium]|uniref:Glycosyltransferase 61 catalytic domain-containing protein n=1 Tax=Cylindrotheca closterium TaxID=2856 RepID=A0AAD2FF63_9STRA|nr:unnamed protein product [Cylindrotheca closterium]
MTKQRTMLLVLFFLVFFLSFMEHLSLGDKLILSQLYTMDEEAPGMLTKPKSYDTSVLGLGQRRSYSTHYCLGPRRIEAEQILDVDMFRSCHFTDVCFAPNGHPLGTRTNSKRHGFSLLYITRDEPDGPEKELHNNPELLKTIIRPQSEGKGPKRGNVQPVHYLIPQIVNQSTATLYQKHWSPITVAIPFKFHQCTNFGHALGDNVFPVFRILKNFGLYHPALRFLPIRLDCANRDTCDGDKCKMVSQLMDPFLRRGEIEPPYHVNGLFNVYYKTAMKLSAEEHQQMKQNKSIPLLCFENVLSGMYYYPDHGEDRTSHGNRENEAGSNILHTGSGDKFLEFRNQYMIRLGVDPGRHLTNGACQAAGQTPSIIILARRPESHGGNGWYEENLVEELEKTLPNEKVTIVDYSIHDIKAQIGMASTAKILVSMGGGASYLAFFLAPGTSALLLKRRCKVHDSFLFDNIPYIRKEYFDASNCTSDLEVFDYVEMAKSVRRSIQHYNRRFC